MQVSRTISILIFVVLAGAAWKILMSSELPNDDPRLVTKPSSQVPSQGSLMKVETTPARPRAKKMDLAKLARLAQAVEHDAPTLDPEAYEDQVEREEMLANGDSEEQRAWRGRWLAEKIDDRWTEAVTEDFRAEAQKIAKDRVSMRDISCRETVCRFYLDFRSIADAEAMQDVQRNSSERYAFQLQNPLSFGEDARERETDFHVEVLIERDRPDSLPPDESPSPTGESNMAGDEGQTIVLAGDDD